MASGKKESGISQEGRFLQLVRDSVTESIRDALGDSAMKVLTYNIPPDLLVSSPRSFHESLQGIVKDATPVIEYLIIRDLSERIGVQLPIANSSLEDSIATARSAMLNGQARSMEE